MFLHCQYCPFAATRCKKLSAFSIFNSYNIYRLFPVTHAGTYTHSQTRRYIYPYPWQGIHLLVEAIHIFLLSIKTKAILSFTLSSPLTPFYSAACCHFLGGWCEGIFMQVINIASYLIATVQRCGLSVRGLSFEPVHTRSHTNCSYSGVCDCEWRMYTPKPFWSSHLNHLLEIRISCWGETSHMLYFPPRCYVPTFLLRHQ